MLRNLKIKNVVLIDTLELDFDQGLTVFTGETGAGKSILLDSLGLALGERADASLVKAGQDQAVVSAIFEIPTNHPVWSVLSHEGIDPETELTLKRVLNRDGRSRAFANGEAVSLRILKQLGGLLTEIQSQNEQTGLSDPLVQLCLLDGFGALDQDRENTCALFEDWRMHNIQWQSAVNEQEAIEREREFLAYALKELDELDPKPGEADVLTEQRGQLQNAQKAQEAAQNALNELTQNGRDPTKFLRTALRLLDRLQDDNPLLTEVRESLEASAESLNNAQTRLEELLERGDATDLEAIDERLYAIKTLARKHRVMPADLNNFWQEISEKYAKIEEAAASIPILKKREQDALALYKKSAEELHIKRVRCAGKLEKAITRQLKPLKLTGAQFSVALSVAPPTTSGSTKIEFLVSTNPGQPLAPLGSVASGGELSRLLLAFKTALAQTTRVPTLVFDEVDMGIGGATASAVGERLKAMSAHAQILVVTHSPQVAAQADRHLFIEKSSQNKQTTTNVRPLHAAERKEEIARMLAGEIITDAARAAAQSLLDNLKT